MFNEFFNELAYNPGPSKGGFLFFLDWANHNLNSVVSSSDGVGPLGRSLVYFNCEVLPILSGAAEINPTVNLLVALLKPPTKAECQAEGILKGGSATTTTTTKAGSERAHTKLPLAGVFSALGASTLGHTASAAGTSTHGGGG